jgi:hypothetical protein
MLTRDNILSASDLAHKAVPCPEWGGDVLIWTVSGAELTAWEFAQVGRSDEDRERNRALTMANLVCLTARDENGNRLFKDSDAAALAGKSARALYRCFRVAQRLNGLRADDFEELEKNSPSVPTGSTCSALLTTGDAPPEK